MNPHAITVEHATIAWATHMGLIQHATDAERFLRLQYGTLMARAYPNAPLPALQLISDWNTWLFLLDDQCDEAGLGYAPDQLAAVHAALLDILHGGSPHQQTPHNLALCDLATRLQAYAGSPWLDRFRLQVAEYFKANIWEAKNRARGRAPNLKTYLAMRPYTGAVYTYLALMEFADKFDLPAAVYAHPIVQQLMEMTNNIICWANDLMSLDKELRHGDVHNLVLVLRHTQNHSIPKAIRLVATMHDVEVGRFQALVASLPSFTAAVDADLQHYVMGLQFWIRANMDWSVATARYRPLANQEALLAEATA
jgi:5-epi-alpha-selinene synthase